MTDIKIFKHPCAGSVVVDVRGADSISFHLKEKLADLGRCECYELTMKRLQNTKQCAVLKQDSVYDIASLNDSSDNNSCLIEFMPAEAKKNTPLPLLRIPFYDLLKRFCDLPSNILFLLYCESGVMSRLQAVYLYNRGFRNVAVLDLDES